MLIHEAQHPRQHQSHRQRKGHREHQDFAVLALLPNLPAAKYQPADEVVNELYQIFWVLKKFPPVCRRVQAVVRSRRSTGNSAGNSSDRAAV